jgi:hypothetical protein
VPPRPNASVVKGSIDFYRGSPFSLRQPSIEKSYREAGAIRTGARNTRPGGFEEAPIVR